MQVSFRQLCDSAFTARRYAPSLSHSFTRCRAAGEGRRVVTRCTTRQDTSIDSGGRPAAAAPQHGAQQQMRAVTR